MALLIIFYIFIYFLNLPTHQQIFKVLMYVNSDASTVANSLSQMFYFFLILRGHCFIYYFAYLFILHIVCFHFTLTVSDVGVTKRLLLEYLIVI